jgi:4-amino-4-deoxy-L-arabinose transferase-like glycosyltransferase
MRTAERPSATASSSARRTKPGTRSRWLAWLALAAILAVALGLRLWGTGQGLPFAYNADEADHFVPHAVAMFEKGTLDPHYFANPPGFTYLLHFAFSLWFGGGAAVVHAFQLHPEQLYTLGRVLAALLGTAAVWLLYVAGARLFGRGVALLASAIEAVAFLPVFYAHLALNDAPTLAPLTLSLVGSAGVLRRGRVVDYVLAGAGLGLACASKYTAGVALLPLAAALAARYLSLSGSHDARAGRRALLGIAVAGGCAVVAFLVANPYSILDYSSFHRELVHQSSLSAEAQGKLGAPRSGGLVYYLWSLGWGLGWAPALAALGGALTIWRSERALGWMLVPAPIAYLAFMGLQGRYFGRWLLPIFPILCLLAAFFAVWLASEGARLLSGRIARRDAAGQGAAARWRPGLRAALLTLLGAGLIAQGLIYSVHAGLLLSRADTRSIARRWMLAHVPAGSRIVAEPISPNEWANQSSPGTSTASNRPRWVKYPSLLPRVSSSGALLSAPAREVTVEDYERTLAPALIGYYEAHGYCWVLTGSTQSGRALADPRAVPRAVAYYRELARSAQVAFRASPYGGSSSPVPFNFDWSFDYYPLAYHRPGPVVTIYRLHGGRCA